MNQLSIALGWTLLHFVWQAAAIAALYGAAELFLRNVYRRYLLGFMAQLGMAVVAVLTFVYEEGFATSPQPRGAVHLSPGFFTQSSHTAILASLEIARMLPWLDGFWILGVTILSIRVLGGWLFLNRLAGSQFFVPEETQHRFSRIARRLRIKSNVGLRSLPGMSAIRFSSMRRAMRAIILIT